MKEYIEQQSPEGSQAQTMPEKEKKQLWFAFDDINGNHEYYDTEEEAKKVAERFLEGYTDAASSDGWPEDFEGAIGYGKITMQTKEKVVAEKKDYTDEEWEEKGYSLDFDRIVGYKIEEVK